MLDEPIFWIFLPFAVWGVLQAGYWLELIRQFLLAERIRPWLRSRREPRRAGSQGRVEGLGEMSLLTKEEKLIADVYYESGWRAAEAKARVIPAPPSSAPSTRRPSGWGTAPPSAGSEQATAPTEDGQSGRSIS